MSYKQDQQDLEDKHDAEDAQKKAHADTQKSQSVNVSADDKKKHLLSPLQNKIAEIKARVSKAGGSPTLADLDSIYAVAKEGEATCVAISKAAAAA